MHVRYLADGDQVFERISLDPTTELLNRAAIISEVEARHRSGRRTSSGDAVLKIDIDRLDAMNHTYGHLVGDRLLIETARTVRRMLRPGDRVGRIGADEFLVLVSSDDADSTARLAENVRRAVEASTIATAAGGRAGVKVSIGLAFLRDPRLHKIDRVLAAAEEALARAKQAGGNRVVVFDEDVHAARLTVRECHAGEC